MIVAMLLLAVWPIKAANTLIMHYSNKQFFNYQTYNTKKCGLCIDFEFYDEATSLSHTIVSLKMANHFTMKGDNNPAH